MKQRPRAGDVVQLEECISSTHFKNSGVLYIVNLRPAWTSGDPVTGIPVRCGRTHVIHCLQVLFSHCFVETP